MYCVRRYRVVLLGLLIFNRITSGAALPVVLDVAMVNKYKAPTPADSLSLKHDKSIYLSDANLRV